MTMDRRTIRHRLNSRAMIRPDRPREGAFALDGAFDVPLLSQRGERILKKSAHPTKAYLDSCRA